MTEMTQSTARITKKQLGFPLAAGIASGLLTLIDPAKLRPGARRATVAASGIVTGAVVWLSSSSNDEYAPAKELRGSLALGMGALAAVGTHYGFVLDRKIHQTLLSRGIRNPRPLMALVSGILSTGVILLEPPAATKTTDHDNDICGATPLEREIPQPLRELLAAMLTVTEDFGAPLLREQLAGAREQHWGEPMEFTTELAFVAPEGASLAVPRNYTFPVHADFTTSLGQQMRVSLQIQDGVLASLFIDALPEQLAAAQGDDADPFEALTRWPLVSEVTFTLED